MIQNVKNRLDERSVTFPFNARAATTSGADDSVGKQRRSIHTRDVRRCILPMLNLFRDVLHE